MYYRKITNSKCLFLLTHLKTRGKKVVIVWKRLATFEILLELIFRLWIEKSEEINLAYFKTKMLLVILLFIRWNPNIEFFLSHSHPHINPPQYLFPSPQELRVWLMMNITHTRRRHFQNFIRDNDIDGSLSGKLLSSILTYIDIVVIFDTIS